MGYIFISYARVDGNFVKRLCSDLEAEGIEVWIDQEQLKPGTSDWEKAVRAGIAEAVAVLLIATPASCKSTYVQDELEIAKARQCPIYPVWAGGDKWIDCVPMGMGRMQHIDARGDRYDEALPIIINTLGRSLPAAPVFPELVISGTPPDEVQQQLKALAYQGCLGSIFRKMQDADCVEACMIDHPIYGSTKVWLRYSEYDETAVCKMGWTTPLEVEKYNQVIAPQRDTPLSLFPEIFQPAPNIHTIARSNISLSSAADVWSLSEWFNANLQEDTELSSDMRWAWQDIIAHIADNAVRLAGPVRVQKVAYSKLYKPRLADFVVQGQAVDQEKHQLTCPDFTASEFPTVTYYGGQFIIWVEPDIESDDFSPRCLSIIPADDEVRQFLIDHIGQQIHLNGICPEDETLALHRDLRLYTVLEQALQTYSEALDTELSIQQVLGQTRRNAPFPWQHFGSLPAADDIPTLYGQAAHGNLRASNIMVDMTQPDDIALWTLDYHHAVNGAPLLKPFASLEASFWVEVAFTHLSSLTDVASLFIRVLSATQLLPHQAALPDEMDRLWLLGDTLVEIRRQAREHYAQKSFEVCEEDEDLAQSLVNNWWLHYVQLLYHELLIYFEDPGTPFYSTLTGTEAAAGRVKLALLTSFIHNMINEWLPVHP